MQPAMVSLDTIWLNPTNILVVSTQNLVSYDKMVELNQVNLFLVVYYLFNLLYNYKIIECKGNIIKVSSSLLAPQWHLNHVFTKLQQLKYAFI